jgi:hypothetical protein
MSIIFKYYIKKEAVSKVAGYKIFFGFNLIPTLLLSGEGL